LIENLPLVTSCNGCFRARGFAVCGVGTEYNVPLFTHNDELSACVCSYLRCPLHGV